MRRIATPIVNIEGKYLTTMVIEIEGEQVVQYYPLQKELPMTEWLPGKVQIKEDKFQLFHAYYNNKKLTE